MPVATSSVTGFGLRLLDRLGAGTVAFSPLSVHRALATLREGADGAARAALDELLGDDAAPPDVRDEAIRLALAQAVWVDAEYRLAPGFEEAAARRGVDCRSLDFGAPGAPGEVNAWAAERTDGMVAHVLDAFAAGEALALADAAYFEGAWTVPFAPEVTAPAPFTRPDGSTVTVPMMERAAWEHAEVDGVQAVRLPYGNEDEIAFVAAVARDGLAAPALDAAAWRRLMAAVEHGHGHVALPRLRLESRLDLRDPLRALGLGPAFEPGADFDGLFEGPGPAKALGRVLHRARVDLDEEGTCAAAVTVATAFAVSMPADPPVPFDIRLDRPFVWAIEHRGSGTLLFLGRVTDPGSTAEEST